MKLGRYTTICREGWYYLFVLGFVVTGALLRDINLLIVVAGMMVGPLLFSFWVIHAILRNVRVKRKLPAGICAGDLLVVGLELASTGKRGGSWAVSVEDRVSRVRPDGSEERTTAGVLFPFVPAGETRQRAYTGRLTQRGRYRFGPLKLMTRFPLGLIRRTITVEADDELIVFPRLGRLTSQWKRRRQQQVSGGQRLQHRQGIMEGEFFGLRDWRPGDSRRWIHWRTSARRGAVVVRQFEQQRNEDLLLLVDLWQPRSAEPHHLENVELAASFAATVAASLCRQGGSQFSLGIGAREIAFRYGAASMVLQSEILEQLALALPSEHDHLADLLAQGLDHVGPSAPIVILSTRALEIPGSLHFTSADESLKARLASRRIECIDVGGSNLANWFIPE